MSFPKEAELADQVNKAVTMRPLRAEVRVELDSSKRNFHSEMLANDDDSIFALLVDRDDFGQDECVVAGTKKNSQESPITHKNDMKGSTSSSEQMEGGEELNLNRPE